MNFEEILRQTKEIGYVESTSFPLISVKGLPDVTITEVVLFESGQFGVVRSIEDGLVNVLVYSNIPISIGSRVVRTNRSLDIPVSLNMLGNTIDALGMDFYNTANKIEATEYYPTEKEAPGIAYRKEINEAFYTGLTIVDMMVPLGKGQRELILGDRQTGKTSFALQVLLRQALHGTVCVYACIGKKKADIERVRDFLRAHNIYDTSLLVVSKADDPLGHIYQTPYTAMAIAEFFKDQGKDVVVILDDLTTHAKYYREISLLSGKFPGRDSYPGDIFYTHSRLLERAGNFDGSSITCLPIVHTVEGDMSGYIQTNLMSMTDGHIFFDKDLFYSGQRPAVNYYLSVTRVGRQTQSPLRWSINRELSTFLALYKRTEKFIHFGAELSEGIKSTLSMGASLTQLFTQSTSVVMDINIQIFLFCVFWSNQWASKTHDEINVLIKTVLSRYDEDQNFRNAVSDLINQEEDINSILNKFLKNLPNYQKYIQV